MNEKKELFDEIIVRIDLAVAGLQNLMSGYLVEMLQVSGWKISGLNLNIVSGFPDGTVEYNVEEIVHEPETERTLVVCSGGVTVDWLELNISSQQALVDRLHHEYIYKLHLYGSRDGGKIN